MQKSQGEQLLNPALPVHSCLASLLALGLSFGGTEVVHVIGCDTAAFGFGVATNVGGHNIYVEPTAIRIDIDQGSRTVSPRRVELEQNQIAGRKP
jgi:hypothetical protein